MYRDGCNILVIAVNKKNYNDACFRRANDSIYAILQEFSLIKILQCNFQKSKVLFKLLPSVSLTLLPYLLTWHIDFIICFSVFR